MSNITPWIEENIGPIVFAFLVYLFFRRLLVFWKMKRRHWNMMKAMRKTAKLYYDKLNDAVAMIEETEEVAEEDKKFTAALKEIKEDIREEDSFLFWYREVSDGDYFSTVGTTWTTYCDDDGNVIGSDERNIYDFDAEGYASAKESAKDVNEGACDDLLRFKEANERLDQYLKNGIRLKDGRRIDAKYVFSPKGVKSLSERNKKIEKSIKGTKKKTRKFNFCVLIHPILSRKIKDVDTSFVSLDFYDKFYKPKKRNGNGIKRKKS